MRASSGDGGMLVRVLGPTGVEVAGAPVNLGGPRQRAVLLRLVLAEGHLVPADRLVADVWGAAAPASAMSTLQAYVSRLRSALDDPSRLRREGPGYVLALHRDEVDARRFEWLLDEAARSTGRPEDVVAALDEALGLWRGAAYADADELDWAATAAVRLGERRLEAVERRFDAMLGAGLHQLVVPQVEQAVAEHPFRERLTGQLMLALYRSGRQAEALRAFERTRSALADELGLDVSPELAALQAAILAHDSALGPPVPSGGPSRVTPDDAAATPAHREAQPPVGRRATGEPTREPSRPGPLIALPPAAARHAARPFVGRVDAMAAARAAWAQAREGRPLVLLVQGEAGAGKSRLAAQLATEVHAAGGAVLWGRCQEESIVPYAPVVEALRTGMKDAPEPVRRRVVESRPSMALLRPFLEPATAVAAPHMATAVASPDAAAGTDRYLLFEAIAETLAQESQRVPILSVIDDVQWADVPTLRLLQHVLQHLGDARLLTVATLRTMPAVPNPELDGLLTALQRDQLLHRVHLGGLAVEEVAELVGLTGEQLGAEAVARLHRATRGNPFFLTELAHAGRFEPSDGAVPPSVRDVLTGRLDQVAPPTARLLNVAAVVGAEAPLPVLAGASGLDGEEVLDALDEAIRAGLLVEERPAATRGTAATGDGADTLVFRHAIVQQVVAARLSGTRRRAIHLAAADAYAAYGGRPADLAHHLIEAGPVVAPARTAAAAVEAGRAALDLLAYEDGVRWAERALERADPGDHELRSAALLLLSDAQRALGDRVGARASATAAAEAARALGDARRLAGAAEAMALARAGLGFDWGTYDPELHELLVDALHRLPADDVSRRSRLLGASLLNAAADRDHVRLHGLRDEALALADAHGHHVLVATAHLAVRMSNWHVDTLELRVESGRRALEAAERAANLGLQLHAVLYLTTDLIEAGAAHEAARRVEQLRALAARVRQPVYDAFVLFADARDALMRGELARAGELADRALAVGQVSHGVNGELAWAGLLFIRAWDEGRLAGLAGPMSAAAAKIPQTGLFHVAADMAALAEGRADEVAARLDDDLHRHWIDQSRDSLWLTCGGLLAEITAALGDAERAAVVLEHLRPYVGRVAVTGLGRAVIGPVSRFVGLAALTAGEVDLAVEQLRDAVALARDFRARVHEARSLDGLAAALERRGRPDDVAEATAARRQAAAIAAGTGVSLAPLVGAAGAGAR